MDKRQTFVRDCTLADTKNECNLECHTNSVSCFPTDSKAVDIATWPDLQNLIERLHLAKNLGTEVSRDLLTLLQWLNDSCKPISNVTFLTQDGVDSSGNAMFLDLMKCPTSCIRMHQMCYDIFGKLPKVVWNMQVIPKAWHRAGGIIIPKQRDAVEIIQFRPIRLLNVEGKAFL